MKNKMVILIGPSGVGKSSFLERALKDFAELRDTVTCTTRNMRKGESEGAPYHFVSRDRFEELIRQNHFIEFAEVHGNLYGTPEHQIGEAWRDGKAIIMDVDVQGAQTFKRKYPQALTIFILPPSVDSLRHRVIKREGKTPADIEIRMANAAREMALADEFDHRLVNDQFDPAYAELKNLIEDFLGNR